MMAGIIYPPLPVNAHYAFLRDNSIYAFPLGIAADFIQRQSMHRIKLGLIVGQVNPVRAADGDEFVIIVTRK